MILLIRSPTLKAYLDDPGRVLETERNCPRCQHRPLLRHGTRHRWVYDRRERLRVPVFRLRCPSCGTTCTLLPDALIPYFRYSGTVIAQAVSDYLDTPVSLRTLAVRLSGADLPADLSVTDALLGTRLTPSYQRIHAWVRRLGLLASSYGKALTAWVLRLRPDSLILHLLASQTPAFTFKGRSASGRDRLRNAALLVILLRGSPELDPSRTLGWLPLLSHLVLKIVGAVPWRAPPSDGPHPARDVLPG